MLLPAPAKMTVVYPFFNHHVTFRHHLATWLAYPAALKARLQFVVVDDCSREPLAVDGQPDLDLEVYRVVDDIVWNYGAKNLGVSRAKHDWLLLSELDHWMSEATARQVLRLPRPPDTYYMFKRSGCCARSAPRYHETVHPATFYLRAADFWRAGGIDEDFAGHYGHDDTFLVDCLRHHGVAPRVPADIRFVNHSDNLLWPDADLKQDRAVPRDAARNAALLAAKRETMAASPDRLRFSWFRVYPA